MNQLNDKQNQTRAEFYMHLIDATVTQLINSGIDQELALQCAYKVAERARTTFGGEQVYLPKDTSVDTQLKLSRIFHEFNGFNQNELAKQYGFSTPYVYQLLKKETLRRQRDNTPTQPEKHIKVQQRMFK